MSKIRVLFILLLPLISFLNSGAQTWKKQAKSGDAGLVDIVFVSKAKGFALSSGKVLITTDSGKTWKQVLSGYTRFSRIMFMDSKNGYIAGYDDLVLKTTDGGDNWSLKSTGYSDDDLTNLYAVNKDTAFVLGPDDIDNGRDSIYLEYTFNGGNSWSRKTLKTLQGNLSILMLNRNRGMIGNLNGGAFQTSNGFTTYNVNNNIMNVSDARSVKDSVIVAVGAGGKIFRSGDYGANWKSINSPTSENLLGLHFGNDSVGMACGEKGVILVTSNAGLSWSKMVTHTLLDIRKVCVLTRYNAWAVAYSVSGDSADILKFDDKTCTSSYVKVPRDTAICDKYDFEAPFVVKGANKATWTINDALTHLNRKNDTVAYIYTVHEGKFIISFELQSCEITLYDTATVFFWKNPTISVKDSLHCGSVNDNIYFNCFACSYLWNDKDDTYNFIVTQPGKYWVKVTNMCKSISDTFTLSFLPYLKLDLGRDTLLCNSETITLGSNFRPGKYLWNDADTSSSKTVSAPGVYSLHFENKCNKLDDTISIQYKKSPTLELGKDSIYCTTVVHDISLDSVKNVSIVKWWDGSNSYNKNFKLPGKYYADVINECGLASDTLNLGVLNIPELDLGRDTIYCNNFIHTITINPKTTDYKIQWWDGADSLSRTFMNPDTFVVRVYNRCGDVRDTLKIDRKTKPDVDLGKDTIIPKPFQLSLDAKNAGSQYLWNTGSNSKTINANDHGKYWVEVSNFCGIDRDTISITEPTIDGMNGQFDRNKISVYPNPVRSDKVYIELPIGEFDLELFDSYGNLIRKSTISDQQHEMEVCEFSQGICFLKISGQGMQVQIIKLMKM